MQHVISNDVEFYAKLTSSALRATSPTGEDTPNARKADEVRLYALRGGLTKQSVCYTHFRSNEVFRGDLYFLFLRDREVLPSLIGSGRSFSFFSSSSLTVSSNETGVVPGCSAFRRKFSDSESESSS